MDAVDAFLADMKADIDCDSVDATVAYVAGNSEPFRFTDEQAGGNWKPTQSVRGLKPRF